MAKANNKFAAPNQEYNYDYHRPSQNENDQEKLLQNVNSQPKGGMNQNNAVGDPPNMNQAPQNYAQWKMQYAPQNHQQFKQAAGMGNFPPQQPVMAGGAQPNPYGVQPYQY